MVTLVSQEQIAVRHTSASWSVPAAQIGDVSLLNRKLYDQSITIGLLVFMHVR